MVAVGTSEDYLTSKMNKPKELELKKKNGDNNLKYYSDLSFQERLQKIAEKGAEFQNVSEKKNLRVSEILGDQEVSDQL